MTVKETGLTSTPLTALDRDLSLAPAGGGARDGDTYFANPTNNYDVRQGESIEPTTFPVAELGMRVTALALKS